MFRKWFGTNPQATNTVQGYLHAASQIEAINQQLEDAVETAITQGTTPWDAYAEYGYALAFVRACRCHVIVVQALIQAPAPNTTLPQDAYDQAIALCAVFEPYLEEAIKAQNPSYRPYGIEWPLKFGPRLQEPGERLSLPLVMGLRNGGQQVQEWVTGFIATYDLALHAGPLQPPESVVTHLKAVQQEMQLGTFHFQTAVDMLGSLSTQQVAQSLLQQACDLLWEALGSFVTVSQFVAHPGAWTQAPQPEQTQRRVINLPAQQMPVPSVSAPVPRDDEVPEQPYGVQEAEGMLQDFAQFSGLPRPVQRTVEPAKSDTVLEELTHQFQHGEELLTEIGHQRPTPANKPQQRVEDTSDLLSDIKGDTREPLL